MGNGTVDTDIIRLTVDELFATMRRDDLSPTIARSERGLWKLYLVDPEYGSLGYAGFAEWPILEGRSASGH